MLKRKQHPTADPNVTAFSVVRAATENVVIPDRLVPVGEILVNAEKPKEASSSGSSVPRS